MLQSLGLILVSGMVAHVTMAAAVGRKLTLGEAWAATPASAGELLGMALLLGLMLILLLALFVLTWVAGVVALDSGAAIALFLLVSIPAFLLALWWFWIRVYYLPVPALMLEDVGIFGAIERGHALTRNVFWRVFGIALLTAIITSHRGLHARRPRDDGDGRPAQWRPRQPVRRPLADPGQRGVLGGAGGLRGPVHGGGDLAAVRRPAHPQGGVRRRADDPGGDHRP